MPARLARDKLPLPLREGVGGEGFVPAPNPSPQPPPSKGRGVYLSISKPSPSLLAPQPRWTIRAPRGTVFHAQPPHWKPTVTLILASRPNVYSSSSLDRVGTRREDTAWIEQQLVQSRHPVRPGLAQPQPGARPGRGRARGGVRLWRSRRRVAHAERPLGLPWHAGRASGVRRRCQHGRRPGAAAARIGGKIRRSALGRLGRAAPGGVGPGARPRADALARPASVLRGLRRSVRRRARPAT